MVPLIEIAVESPRWSEAGGEGDDPLSLEGLAETVIGAAVARTAPDLHEEAEISLVFCDDAFIRGLNQQWRGLDKPTNVLSFPTDEALSEARLLGDVIIAFETTEREALEESKPFRAHLSHLIIHGFLHLLGFDHETPEEAEEMEAMERAILGDLGIADPYQGALLAEEPHAAAVAPVRGESKVCDQTIEAAGER